MGTKITAGANKAVAALEKIREINLNNIRNARKGGFHSIIIDTPTGTGKTYSIPFYIRELWRQVADEDRNVDRVFISVMQTEQRDALGAELMDKFGADRVLILKNNTDRLLSAWTPAFCDVLRDLSVYDSFFDQVENLKGDGGKSSLLPGERDPRDEYLSRCVFRIWRNLTIRFLYDGKERTFRARGASKKGRGKQASADNSGAPDELALAQLRNLFPLELDREHKIGIVVMTAKKMITGVSRNPADDVFFGPASDTACIIDESDAFFAELLQDRVEKTADQHTSIPELLEDLYLKLPRLFTPPPSWDVDTDKYTKKVSDPARELVDDLASFFRDFGLVNLDDTGGYIRNILYEEPVDGGEPGNSLRIAQWHGRVTSIGKAYSLHPGETEGTAVVVTDEKHDGFPSLNAYLIASRQLIDRAAKLLRMFSYEDPRHHETSGASGWLLADSIRKSACNHIGLSEDQTRYMCGIMFPENVAGRLETDDGTGTDPFLSGLTLATLDDGQDHITKTRIESYSLQVLPALFIRSMLHNCAFTVFLSATGRYDAMGNIPMEYIRADAEKRLLYETPASDIAALTKEVSVIKGTLYGKTPPRVFIEKWSVDGFYDNGAAGQPHLTDDERFSLTYATLTPGFDLDEGLKEYLAYVLQVMLDEFRFREALGEDTFVFSFFQTRKLDPKDVFRFLRHFACLERPETFDVTSSLFFRIASECRFACVEKGRLYFYDTVRPDPQDPSAWRLDPVLNASGKPDSVSLDDIKITHGTKLFIFCAERSGGRGFDHSISLDGKKRNLSGIALKRFANILPGVYRGSTPREIITAGANLVNAGYIGHAPDTAWGCLDERLRAGNSICRKDPFPDDDRSPYKIEQDVKIAQVLGRFRNDPPLGQTVIRIDEQIVSRDRLLIRDQFMSVSSDREPIPCMLGFELSCVLDAAEEWHSTGDQCDSAFERWNRKAEEAVKGDMKKLGLAKKEKNRRDLPALFRRHEARKIACRTGGQMSYIDLDGCYPLASEWLNGLEQRSVYDTPRFAVRSRDLAAAFWEMYFMSNEPVLPGARSASLFVENLYEPLAFYRDLLPAEEVSRIEAAFAPVLSETFRQRAEKEPFVPYAYSGQCVSYFAGECGETFTKALLRMVLAAHKDEAHMLAVMELPELVGTDMAGRYEDADIFLHQRVAVDAKAHVGDILLAEDAAGDEGYRAMANKFSRMPDGRNYLLFIDTRFTGNEPGVEVFTTRNHPVLRKLCKETGKDVVIYALNHLFTKEDVANFTPACRFQYVMQVERFLWEEMLYKVCRELEKEKTYE